MGSKTISRFVVLFLMLFGSVSDGNASTLRIDYNKYKLDNGLQVILHEDRSDPIVAVAIVYHVGSNREVKGRTGFAHLFEHMMFQESQHVGQDQLFKKIQDAGGTLNGFTTFDATCYFEVVPNNALEMVLWLESDRMGYLLSTVTRAAFDNQQEVVQNEKRQRVDNQPYGHTNYVIHKSLYPESHPYNWQVIGSLEDLEKATVQNVRDFFTRWYGPNNATLVIAGDYDKRAVKKLVDKYFGEIKPSTPVTDRGPTNITLDKTKRAFHEDNFAKSPELNMVFPTVQEYSEDAYALSLLSDLLADGKKAPIYKVLVEEKKLAPSVSAFQSSRELTGYFRIRIRSFPDINLGDVERALFEAFQRFEEEGFTKKDLARIKAKTETRFYNGISSVLGKSFELAFYNEYAGSPGFIRKDLKGYLDVAKDDVMRVYRKYIKDKPYILTSFVPKGKTNLVAEISDRFPVVEEAISDMTEEGETLVETEEVAQIPASFDRSIEPSKGPSPEITQPTIWQEEMENGLRVLGIEHDELPLIQFSLTLKGGLLQDNIDEIGAANLMTDIMMEGTENKTPVELEEAIDELGSTIWMYTTKTSIVIQANMLASKFDETYELFEEILLEPRWDEKEFARIKDETIEIINRRKASPAAIATDAFNKLVYGEGHILGYSTLGTAASVAEITIDDLRRFYRDNFSPSVSHISIAGDISRRRAVRTLNSLEERWQAKQVKLPQYETPPELKESKLYFADFPGAKQSQIRIGYLALSRTDPDYYPAYVMNYKLGGSFSGSLNLILREEKGYTYGARSGFSGTHFPGPFTASSAVRSNATFESMQIFMGELAEYSEMISKEDLKFTKNALIQSNARRFETLGALRGMLDEIALYGRPVDYITKREAIVRNMTQESHQKLAEKYIVPNRMIYLVVGDAETQLEKLKDLGLGDPILLDKDGNPAAAVP